MEESSETSIVKTVESESLSAIKSKFNIKQIFSFLNEYRKFETIKYNKKYQNLFTLNIESYKKKSCRYKIGGINGPGKEFSLDNDSLVFEGEYLNKKRNGKGKEYNDYGFIIFKGEYLNDKEWIGIRYDRNGNIKYKLTNNINGKGKEYYDNGNLRFEGEYLNGKRNGKGKEYNDDGNLIFEGEYIYGKKLNGKGKEYVFFDKLRFEGEYLNGKRNGKGKEYNPAGKIIFEGEYLNGIKKK